MEVTLKSDCNNGTESYDLISQDSGKISVVPAVFQPSPLFGTFVMPDLSSDPTNQRKKALPAIPKGGRILLFDYFDLVAFALHPCSTHVAKSLHPPPNEISKRR
jgi:hypothetical protein